MEVENSSPKKKKGQNSTPSYW